MMLSIFLACAAAPVVPPVQDAGSQAQPDPYEAVLEYYQPMNAPPEELQMLMYQLSETNFFSHKVRYPDSESLEPVYVFREPSVLVFGDSILVRDSRAEIANTMKHLREFDARFSDPRKQVQPESRRELRSFEVTHVGLRSVGEALLSIYNVTQTRAGFSMVEPPTFSFVEEKNLVLVRGTQSQIAEAEAVLKRMDVPQPRVMLECYLVSGASDAETDPRVPTDLAADLAQLVPYAGFELWSSAFLPSNTSGPVELKVELDGRDGELQLQMVPEAFDSTSGTLTLGRVDFELSLLEGKRRTRRSFTTSTMLRRGEYTVLGAVGADPVFVVIKLRGA